MDSRRLALALVEPLRPGDSLLAGVVFRRASAELGLRLSFETITGPVDLELGPVASMQRFAARTNRIAVAYRTDNAAPVVNAKLGEAICKAVASLIEPNEHRLDELRDERSAARVREVEVAELLEWRALGPDAHYALSPYVGCTIGCRFCYAQTRLDPVRALLRLPQVPWGSYVDVRVNAAEVLTEELARLPPGIIKFCPIVSDPFQPLEARHRITRACLDVLGTAPPGWRVMLLSRAEGMLDDIERIAALPGAIAGVSIPTLDETVLRHFEPRAATGARRLQILDQLREASIETMAVVQPVLPGPIDAFADALASRVGSVSLGVLEGEAGAGSLFDHPAYVEVRNESWQLEHATALRDALVQRGVAVWHGELPPDA